MKFKVTKTDDKCKIIIGVWIINENENPPIDTLHHENEQGYAWWIYGISINQHCGYHDTLKCNVGDVIHIIKFKKLTLSYR